MGSLLRLTQGRWKTWDVSLVAVSFCSLDCFSFVSSDARMDIARDFSKNATESQAASRMMSDKVTVTWQQFRNHFS